ncbi:LysR family transcriptional regulator [Streptomyces sp. NPDC101249]|uniref:LysR family transcriptional regulator n=1 Tax=Streptomyces sp. NPDC101249 TaxID=3366140 RepID=UPI003802D3F9
MTGGTPGTDLIDMRLLRTFMVVAQELNFTRAGALLHLTQQTVSSQVRTLETGLGVELFRRTTRHVRLTEAGLLLRQRMQPILEAMDEAVVEAQELARRDGVVFVVGHTASAAHRLLPRAAGFLERIAPGLRLRCEQRTELGLRAAVAEGSVHLGVGLEVAFPAARIASHQVGPEPWCAVVGPQHPLAGGGPLTLADLSGYEWLSWPRSSHPGHWRAVHRLAALAPPERAVRETWLSVAHTRLGATDAVMLQPLSYAAHPARGLVTLDVVDAPAAHFTAVWSTLTTPPCLNQVLSALSKAAEYPLERAHGRTTAQRSGAALEGAAPEHGRH